jgi:tagatose 6-phosphate kinase
VIQCVCLNPVYQRTLTIENFQSNRVNRVKGTPIESVGGKGVNLARAVQTLGQDPMITGFIGGETGQFVEQYLDGETLAHDFVHTTEKTRTCTTLLDPVNKTHTELVEEGRPVTSEEVEAMYAVYNTNLRGCDLVTICGSVPRQVPDDIYYHFVKQAAVHHIRALVDTQKALLQQVLPAAPWLLKINRDELGAAFQQPIESAGTLYQLVERVQQAGVAWVVITHGNAPIVVAHQGEYWEITPPLVSAVNPIGAGDVMLGGIAATLTQGQEVLPAICFGAACGTASTLTLTPGVIRVEDVERLQPEVIVQSKA